MPSALPLPPSGTPYIDPRTGQVNILWQNYLLALTTALQIDVAPKDARYVTTRSEAELDNEINLGALTTGYLRVTVVLGIAVPSTTATIPAIEGGTGQTTYTVGDLLYASAAGALSKLAAAATGNALISGGAATAPAWGKIGLATHVSGVLGLATGGTNADLSATGGTSQVLRQSSAGAAVTVSQLAIGNISGMGTTATAYAAGTAYSLTDTAAAIDVGTTDPAITLTSVGTYLLMGQVHLAYNGATVATETASVKIRRTNNTAADLSPVVVIDLPVSTVLTHSYGVVSIPPVIYTTAATDDAVALFANVSAALGAGSIDATAVGTSLVAVRIAG